ncbi:MAG: hypothetical protein AABY22_29940 [Nanoarchaeota archaeon]
MVDKAVVLQWYDLAMYLKNARNIMFDKVENCIELRKQSGAKPISEKDYVVIDALIRAGAYEKHYDLCYKLSVARDCLRDKINALWTEELLKTVCSQW